MVVWVWNFKRVGLKKQGFWQKITYLLTQRKRLYFVFDFERTEDRATVFFKWSDFSEDCCTLISKGQLFSELIHEDIVSPKNR